MSTSSNESEFKVEKVLGRRIRNGKVEYLIEWGPSWEIEEHLHCPDLVKEFEQQSKKKSRKQSANINTGAVHIKKINESDDHRSLPSDGKSILVDSPEKILGANEIRANLMFKVNFSGMNDGEYKWLKSDVLYN